MKKRLAILPLLTGLGMAPTPIRGLYTPPDPNAPKRQGNAMPPKATREQIRAAKMRGRAAHFQE